MRSGTAKWMYSAMQAGILFAMLWGQAHAQQRSGKPETPQVSVPRDGQHDFDFEIGAWKTKLKRLAKPLSGSQIWIEYEGTTVVREIWDGRANLVELEVTGEKGRIQGASWRLYNPETRQWSLNFANSRTGVLTAPVFGEFRDARGEFYGQDTLNGRVIQVRFIITPMTSDTCHFEQAFSDDGGKTWEVNWIADDTRIKETPKGKH